MDIIDKIREVIPELGIAKYKLSKRKAKQLIEEEVYKVLTRYEYDLDCALAKGTLLDEPPVELFREIAREVVR
jgi:hypothetical protein